MLSVKKDIGSFKAKDIICWLNGRRINDIIDLRFYAASRNKLVVSRGGKKYALSPDIRQINSLTFEQDIPNVKKCINSCIFCFLKQLPKNLRKTLYFNDDDWRLSFLAGNFITLTNFNDDDLRRVRQQRVSPLYVSIHCTDKQIRNNLGLKKEDFALRNLESLDEAGIMTHLQIVLCPGLNDGQVLLDTLNKLQQLKNVKSVGLVPVGLTRFHQNGLRIFSGRDAKELIEIINSLQQKYRLSRGCNWAYLADEFYLMAGMSIPGASYYDGFEQLENGIGLVQRWLEEFKTQKSKLKTQNLKNKRPIGQLIVLTGKLFGPVLKKALDSLNLPAKFKVQIIDNDFFGPNITVAGLLTAQDIIKRVRPTNAPVLIPDIMANEDNLFLDDVSFSELKKSLPSAILVPSSGKLFAQWLNTHLSRTTDYGLLTTGVS